MPLLSYCLSNTLPLRGSAHSNISRWAACWRCSCWLSGAGPQVWIIVFSFKSNCDFFIHLLIILKGQHCTDLQYLHVIMLSTLYRSTLSVCSFVVNIVQIFNVLIITALRPWYLTQTQTKSSCGLRGSTTAYLRVSTINWWAGFGVLLLNKQRFKEWVFFRH